MRKCHLRKLRSFTDVYGCLRRWFSILTPVPAPYISFKCSVSSVFSVSSVLFRKTARRPRGTGGTGRTIILPITTPVCSRPRTSYWSYWSYWSYRALYCCRSPAYASAPRPARGTNRYSSAPACLPSIALAKEGPRRKPITDDRGPRRQARFLNFSTLFSSTVKPQPA